MTAPSPAQISLWSQSAASKHSADIQLLKPLVLELARKAWPAPIIAADVRIVAVQRGLLSGGERGRTLSWLGGAMKAAGLVRAGGYRRSHVDASHGNLQAEWTLPVGAIAK